MRILRRRQRLPPSLREAMGMATRNMVMVAMVVMEAMMGMVRDMAMAMMKTAKNITDMVMVTQGMATLKVMDTGILQKKSRHDSRVNSFSIVREGEIDPKKLGMWMQSLASFPEEKGTIFRIKAILAVKGHPYKHVFHAVMDVSDENDAGPWKEGEKKISKIVFIGKGMDQKLLKDGFHDTFV